MLWGIFFSWFVCVLVFWLFVWLVSFIQVKVSLALEPVLELALVDQAGLELTEFHLPLPSECWD